MRVVFDCWPFFQEVDMIALRYATLKDSGVFAFIGVESSLTHAGHENPTMIPSVVERLDPEWKNWYVNHPNTPVLMGKGITPFALESTYWHPEKNIVLCRVTEYDTEKTIAATRRREMRQRNAILHAIGLYYTPLSHDLVMISDVDEIPDPAVIPFLNQIEINSGTIFVLEQKLCYYNVNTSPMANKDGYVWAGTRITQMNDALALSPHIVRYGIAQPDDQYPVVFMLHKAGWHFSYFGGEKAVARKMDNFLHQELNPGKHKEFIPERIQDGKDPWGRGDFVMSVTDNVPEPMLDPRQARQWSHFWHPAMIPWFGEEPV